MDHGERYLGLELGRFLDLLASPEPAPSGGGAAALAVALGGALCAMTARLSARRLGTEEATALTADAQRLSAGAASLIQADADSYQGVLEARRRLASGGPQQPAGDSPQRPAGSQRGDLAAALSAASAVPVQIAELGAATARMAARLAAAGNPNVRGDAITGAQLAGAGARAAAALVAINLAGAPDDPRPARAARLADEATSLAAAAAGAPDQGAR